MVRRRPTALAALAVCALLAGAAAATAAPGDIDAGFGSQGVVQVDAGGTDTLGAVSLAPDGAIVAVGDSSLGGIQILRRLAGGAPDPAFAGGRVAVGFGGGEDGLASAIQPDGKVLAAGAAAVTGGGFQIAVARLKPSGALDATPQIIANQRARETGVGPGIGLGLGFDEDGRKLIDFDAGARARGMALQPDGKILLASGGGDTDLRITRLLSDGSLDAGFAAAGIRGVELGLVDEAAAITRLPDGRILVAANRTNGVNLIAGSSVHLIRLLAGGALDPAFGQGGIAVLGPGYADAMVRLADGSIVVAGRTGTSPGAAAVWRTSAAGLLDGTFGLNGRATVSLGGDSRTGARGLAVQPNGKLVLAATRTDAGSSLAYAVRLQPGGTPDSTFALAGQRPILTSPGAPDQFNEGAAVAIQADGGIVIAGTRARDMALTRLEGDPVAAGGGGVGGGGVAPGAGGPAPGAVAVPRCAGRRATIVGTPRRDVLRGTRRADVIVALGGDDVVRGLGGADVICGGAGRDLLIGGLGADRLLGQAGRDTLRGGPGRDALTGGLGRDSCAGGAARDRAPACERRTGI